MSWQDNSLKKKAEDPPFGPDTLFPYPQSFLLLILLKDISYLLVANIEM